MNTSKLLLFALLSICFCACTHYSINYTHKLTQPTTGASPKEMAYKDSIIGASFAFTSDFSRLVVSVTNNSADKSLFIHKDKCALVIENKSKPLCFINDKHADNAPMHTPLMIPPHAQYIEEITPIDNIAFYTEKDKYTHIETTSWVTYPLYTTLCKGNEELQQAKHKAIDYPIKYVLTYSYQNTERSLSFELTVDSVRIKEL